MAAGEFSSDAFHDLIVVTGEGNALLLKGNGDGTFELHTSRPVASTGFFVKAQDMNRDGHLDVVLFGSEGVLEILRGDGSGGFAGDFAYGVPSASGAFTTSDLDHDGRTDVAVTSYARNLVSLMYNMLDTSTPVLASPSEISADPDLVRITWQGIGLSSFGISVERNEDGVGGWVSLGPPGVSSADVVHYEDRLIRPGIRYGYRLALRDAEATRYTAESWVLVPGRRRIAILGVFPTPAISGKAVKIALSLADSHPAVIELLDVMGRLRRTIELPSPAPGERTERVMLPGDLRAGLYFVRLRQGHYSATMRLLITS
jgi:hypothetical protein